MVRYVVRLLEAAAGAARAGLAHRVILVGRPSQALGAMCHHVQSLDVAPRADTASGDASCFL